MGDPIQGHPVRGQQDDPSPAGQADRHRRPPRQGFERRAGLTAHLHHPTSAWPGHHVTPSPEIA